MYWRPLLSMMTISEQIQETLFWIESMFNVFKGIAISFFNTFVIGMVAKVFINLINVARA
jgi:hypothetical protein